MKKAGIITHYDVHNHGAHLQLYALIQELKKMGYEAKALRYHKNYDFIGSDKADNKYNISIKSIPIYMNYLLENGFDRTLYNIKKRKALSDFRDNMGLIGDYYSMATDLDVVVIGSDEIFSVEAGPNPWYYGIGVPCHNIISYAASFGPCTLKVIDEHNISDLVEAGLKHIDNISVRDNNSAEIVEHYTGKKPIVVCDPVLLYDFHQQLRNKKSIKNHRNKHGKYCIIYSYDYNMNDGVTVNAIKRYAQKRNLKIFSIGYFHKWCDKNFNVDPLELFQWFMGAEMVFTDTYHGSVISLVSGTQFISRANGNENKLVYLLEQYGVFNRRVYSFNSIEEIANKPIDYTAINSKILEIRNQSSAYLKTALSAYDKN